MNDADPTEEDREEAIRLVALVLGFRTKVVRGAEPESRIGKAVEEVARAIAKTRAEGAASK